MTVTIRRLRRGDLRQVLTIERRAFPEDPWTTATAGGWPARATLGGRAFYAAWLARFIQLIRLNEAVSLVRLVRLVWLGRPAGLCYLVAETGPTIAGYACFHVAAPKAELLLLAVRPERQGQRVGTGLLTEMIALTAALGCREAGLYVRADNPGARRFYQRAGFVATGALPGFYQPSGTDAIVMSLRPLPRSPRT